MPKRFIHILKLRFVWQVEKFWEVRAVKKKVANAIIHSKPRSFLGCELDHKGAVFHPYRLF